MDITSNGEFGYEMILVVPYANWLNEQGLLTSTTACIDTKPLYFFSKNHKEVYTRRTTCLGSNTNILGAAFRELHLARPNFMKWKFPDYKSYFKNDIFIYEKPIIIVSNKRYSNYSTQRYGWFNDEQLEYIFQRLSDKYQVIYNRAKSNKITVDQQLPDDNDEGDIKLCEQYGVIDINHLHTQYSDMYSFNELQFMLHANSEHFISVQGGSSILSSAFGGTNLIYATGGGELIVNSYKNWYHAFSNCNVNHAQDFDTFKQLLTELFI
jgi:hypothetical protein